MNLDCAVHRADYSRGQDPVGNNTPLHRSGRAALQIAHSALPPTDLKCGRLVKLCQLVITPNHSVFSEEKKNYITHLSLSFCSDYNRLR
jgi:hypothetical protein